MSRATNSPASRARRKKWLKRARGFLLGRHCLYRQARAAVERAYKMQYRDRRQRKRQFRRLWIVRVNAACRMFQISYSRFIDGLKKANIGLDRKVLADIAVKDIETFGKLVDQAKAAAK